MVHPLVKKVLFRSMNAENKNSTSMNYAIDYLKDVDSGLTELLNSFDIEELKPEKNYFKSLSRSVIYQQLSTKAAKKITERFVNIFKDKSYPFPYDVIKADKTILKSAGLSKSKVEYIKNIAEKFIHDPDLYNNLGDMDDEAVIDNLVKIKGVGIWTAEMFLIFSLNRMDIFPISDLGVQKGFKQYYKLEKLPELKEVLKKSMVWSPYRTVVSLYLWRLIEGPFDW